MTIKQVAEKAGVSVASVSNVINGNYHKVSAETRRKIEQIIEETGYEGKDFFFLGQMAPTPAYDSEVIYLYYARQGEFKGQHLDADEDLNVSKMTLDEITAKIVSGEITDAKTMGMTFLVKAYKEGKYD